MRGPSVAGQLFLSLSYLHLLDKRPGTQRFKKTKMVLAFLGRFPHLPFLMPGILRGQLLTGWAAHRHVCLWGRRTSCVPAAGPDGPVTSAAPAVLLQGSCHTATQRPIHPACADLLTPPVVLTPVQPWKRAMGQISSRQFNSLALT